MCIVMVYVASLALGFVWVVALDCVLLVVMSYVSIVTRIITVGMLGMLLAHRHIVEFTWFINCVYLLGG